MFMDVIQPLLDWIGQNPGLAWGAIFFIALSECLAVVGLLLPGTIILFGIGAVIATGKLDLVPTLIAVAAGAVVGDQISYWIGRHFQQRLHVVWPFRRYPQLLRRGTNFFFHHGGKSVFLCRFLGPVRPILPAVAGMMHMPASRFAAIDTLSALLWSPAYILPGVLFGASLDLAAEVAGRLAVLLTLVLAVLWFSLWLVRRSLSLIQSQAGVILLRFLDWTRNHPRIRPLAGALLDPEHPEARGLMVLAGLWALASITFALLLSGILGNAPLAGLDHFVYHLLQGLRTPWADEIMVRITELGDHFVRNCVFIAVLIWLAWTGHRSAAIHCTITYAIVAVLTKAFKLFAHVPRPMDLYEGTAHFAFPSGHASMSMTLYGFLAVLIAGELSPSRRWLPYGLAALLIVPIGLSRLYLGAHWLTDVIGGIALGFCWVALLGIAYRRHPRPAIALPGLIFVVVSSLLLAAAWHSQRMFAADMKEYAVSHVTSQLQLADWRNQGWQLLPTYRQDVEGSRRHPLTLQWAGAMEEVEKQLQAGGWHRPESQRFSSGLRWLAPSTPIDRLPILPQVHNGQHESLRMIRKNVTNNEWLIVRLWNSNFVITETKQPVWVGNVSQLEELSPFQLFSILHTGNNFNLPLEHFEPSIAPLGVSRHRRPNIPTCDNQKLCKPVWDGSVLLVAFD